MKWDIAQIPGHLLFLESCRWHEITSNTQSIPGQYSHSFTNTIHPIPVAYSQDINTNPGTHNQSISQEYQYIYPSLRHRDDMDILPIPCHRELKMKWDRAHIPDIESQRWHEITSISTQLPVDYPITRLYAQIQDKSNNGTISGYPSSI